jgi:glycosyltransferase involved in cell wall biosynthesis
VAADIPALREVGGDAAMYASPTRPDELAAAISRLLDSDTESRRQQEKGLERAAKFDWSVTAAKTLVQLHAVAAGP